MQLLPIYRVRFEMDRHKNFRYGDRIIEKDLDYVFKTVLRTCI